jgi:hypothetical protein
LSKLSLFLPEVSASTILPEMRTRVTDILYIIITVGNEIQS